MSGSLQMMYLKELEDIIPIIPGLQVKQEIGFLFTLKFLTQNYLPCKEKKKSKHGRVEK